MAKAVSGADIAAMIQEMSDVNRAQARQIIKLRNVLFAIQRRGGRDALSLARAAVGMPTDSSAPFREAYNTDGRPLASVEVH